MKKIPPLLWLILLTAVGYGQHGDSKYAVFDKKMVMLKDLKKDSELVCVVPKGDAVRIVEKVKGPIYKAQYGDWNGYIVSFNLKNRLSAKKQPATKTYVKRSSGSKHYVTLSRRTYITKKSNYKLVVSVPKKETIEVMDRVKKGKYLVRYKNHVGYTDLNSYNVKNEVSQALLSTMKINKASGPRYYEERFPPILSIDDVTLTKPILKADSYTRLKVTLSNSGIGDANKVYVRLRSQNPLIEHAEISHFPAIGPDGGQGTVFVDIRGDADLRNGIAKLYLEVIDEEFNGPVLQREVRILTEELPKPKLVIPHYVVRETESQFANNRIDLNEMVDLNFTIRNDGKVNAESLKISVASGQTGVILLGLVKNNFVQRQNTQVKTILPGEYYKMTYRYFVNSEFRDQALKFKISGSDQYHGIDFSADLVFPLDEAITDGYVFESGSDNNDRYFENYEHRYNEAPIYDVDINIPVTREVQKHTYALIIGNEDYTSRQRSLTTEQNAKYAVNDAEVFKSYCHKTLGVPDRHIKLLRNATAAEISQGLAWVNNLARIEKGKAKIIFYYSGHGLPDEKTKSPVLIPVDVSANNLEYGIPLSDAYHSLIEHPSKQVTVFLDACFSGGGRNHGLLNRKGIKVKANKNVILGNMVVFSSSSARETSSIFSGSRHGYFTYYLLKKLKETKGNIDYDSLGEYLINTVSKETALNGIIQTPEVNFSQKVADDWKKWSLK
ncbi:caspase family protein [Lutimonas sp.]|uniref:caspase family protein n=1 Tax=Lutimonas sp. TaxID=1872403 RepID=UPI003D9B8372